MNPLKINPTISSQYISIYLLDIFFAYKHAANKNIIPMVKVAPLLAHITVINKVIMPKATTTKYFCLFLINGNRNKQNDTELKQPE